MPVAKMCSCSRSLSDDFDSYKPWFIGGDTEEEFYHDIPAPSEDIWKKFELLPTPPRSPKHETNYAGLGLPSTLEKLNMVSNLLDESDSNTDISLFEDCDMCGDSKDSNLKSNLIQDCMWSGLNLAKELNLNLKPAMSLLSGITNTSTSSCTDIISADCVDPAAVFPYPINDTTRDQHSLGAETPSDSDDDDEEDEDEDDNEDNDDDEEIDVVSVSVQEKAAVREPAHKEPVLRKPFVPATPTSDSETTLAHVTAMHNYNAPRPADPKPTSSPARQQQSQSMSRRYRQHSHGHKRRHHNHDSSKPPLKKLRISIPNNSDLRAVVDKIRSRVAPAASESTGSSDSEDGDRRYQHNVLERKRRNDLKSSFLTLRDHVPELSTQEKAPKVVILRRAAEFIRGLRDTEQRLQAQAEYQRHRQQQLQRRLRQLRAL